MPDELSLYLVYFGFVCTNTILGLYREKELDFKNIVNILNKKIHHYINI